MKLKLLTFYTVLSTLLGGYTIYRQSLIITELAARQPIITEECLDGVLHQVQNFNGLKVYDSKFEECGK